MRPRYPLLLLAALIPGAPFDSRAALRPDKIYIAEATKRNDYLKDGLVVGGDRAINQVTVSSIRRATNVGYDRIVIDLEGTRDGETAAIPRPPYYQVAVNPEEKRLVLTIFGSPDLSFNAPEVVESFRKSPVVDSIELLPRVNDDSWTFVINLKVPRPVEVFELKDPVRLILDIRRS